MFQKIKCAFSLVGCVRAGTIIRAGVYSATSIIGTFTINWHEMSGTGDLQLVSLVWGPTSHNWHVSINGTNWSVYAESANYGGSTVHRLSSCLSMTAQFSGISVLPKSYPALSSCLADSMDRNSVHPGGPLMTGKKRKFETGNVMFL